MKLEKRQKYAIRKLSVGVASVLAAQFYVGTISDVPEVQAGEVVGTEVANKIADVSAGKPKDIEDEVIGKKQDSTVENSTNTETKPKSEENPNSVNLGIPKKSEEKADKKTTDKVDSKEKEAEKTSEAKEKEDKKSLEKKEVQEAKDTLSNRLLESRAVSQEAEKYIAGKEVSAEVRTKLTMNLESSKQEESKAQQLLTKDKATLEELNNSVRTIEATLEVLYLELRGVGHSGKVSYRLDAETTSTPTVFTPISKTVYSYLANESTNVEFSVSKEFVDSQKDGNQYYNDYDVVREFELNKDAKDLGFGRIYDGFLEFRARIGNTIEPGTYHPGFIFKGKEYTTELVVKSVNELPYITVENESGYSIVTKDGREITLSYKTGTSRIDPKEGVELTQGAKDLGLTYDSTNQRISGKITLDKTVKEGTYDIGLVSKDGQYKKSIPLTIRNPGTFEINTRRYASYILNPSAADGSESNLVIPTTTFGYAIGYDSENVSYYNPEIYSSYLKGYNYLNDPYVRRTIKDAKKDTLHYYTEFGLRFTDSSVPLDKVRIDKFERLDKNTDVAYELVDISKGESHNWDINYSYEDKNPYRVRFTKLPKQQENFIIKFKTTDSFGTEKIFTVPVRTQERAVANDRDNRLNYYLTHADVLFKADKLYQVENPIPVAIEKKSETQELGDLVLNKENAELMNITASEGITITRRTDDPTKYKITKENGVILPVGVHKITAKAKDGHYGEDAPVREFTFEVMDGLNAIGDQTWTEGQVIPNIPVSMTNGSKITNLTVESEGDYIWLSPNADNTGVVGYALKKTDKPQTAYVTATYMNNAGESRQIKTKFTYEVNASPVTELSLEISNDKQTVSEGTKFADMVITATEGATVTVDSAKLPEGIKYDENSKTLSGTGQYEGRYFIPVTATKDNKSITKIVDLTVTPGSFNVPTANYTYTAGEPIPPITLKLPANANVSSVGGTLPRGLNWSTDNKTITGTPTQVGTFQAYAYVYRTDKSGNNQYAYANINITVNSVPLNFSIPDNEKRVKVLDELPPINLQADGAVLSITSGSLPPGVNYDATTKTVSGTPTKVGTYTATFTATSPTISGNSTASATLTIEVTPRDLSVDVKDKEQEIDVLSAIEGLVLTPSDDKARLEVDTSKLPPGVTYDPASRTISGTPSKVGEYLIPYKATFPEMAESPVDGGHIKINVRPLPVSINVTEKEQTIRLGETIKSMVVSHSEHSNLGARYLSVDLPEGDIDSYLESTAGLNYNSATHTISGTPTKPGTYIIRLKATLDSELLGKGTSNDNAEATIILKVVDDPVSLDIKNDRQMIALGKTSLRPITFTVPDGVSLTVDTTKLPAGVTYDESAKTISGTPTVTGAFDIPVTVTSAGGKSITKDITIDIVDLTPPTPSTPTVTVEENNDGTHTITISQPGGQPVSTVIKNGKDGETPKVKVARDETTKETTLTFYSDKNSNNQFDEGTDTVLGTSVIKDGQDGVAGAKGEKGETGATGAKGDKGEQGPQGERGQDGVAGPKGDKGDNGKDGFTPAVSVVTNPDGSHTISITQPDGKDPITTTIKNGENGQDGRAPSVELKPIYPAQPRSARRARSVDSTPAPQPTAKPIGVHITVYYDNDNNLTYNTGDTLISEEDIYNGVDGRDGIDGKSSTIETKENQGGTYTITIINPDGSKREIVVKNGQDGKSSTIETKENADGTRTIVITNSDGTKQEFVVKNGKDGRDGKDGIDGKSSTIETKGNADGTRTIIITNPDGTKQELVVKDGKDGRDGKDGKCACEDKPTNDKPQGPKEDKPEHPREDKPQEPKGDKPETPREDKPQEPKGDKPETPREDKPQEPKGDKPETPRGDKPQEPKGDKPETPRGDKPQVPTRAPEQLVPTIESVEVDAQKGMLAKTGEGKTDTSVFIGSTVLLALYLLRRKEN
ncbi:putative Ig domain-containing protein [uncultured Gemella sp.]|uniref:collagen-flanked surface repeat-containing protein n=1 Tax=uncultured Gemella sp. TaxID=254352 RepID=UPI0028D8AEEB|nr:putative Ig domain-containing protein [uncultured Gemella sp.]